MLEVRGEGESYHRNRNRKHKWGPQRQRQYQRLKLDTSAFLESEEKPYWMLRNKRGGEDSYSHRTRLNPAASCFVPTRAESDTEGSLEWSDSLSNCNSSSHTATQTEYSVAKTSPRGYDPNVPLIAVVAEIRQADKKVSLPFVAKTDLNLQQLKGTLRVQLGLPWLEMANATFKMFRRAPDYISEETVRDNNLSEVLNDLAKYGHRNCIRVYV
jgi:hypothetical protein